MPQNRNSRSEPPVTRLFVKAGNIAHEAFVNSQEVIDTFGRLDYAVNCAGILGGGLPSTETTMSTTADAGFARGLSPKPSPSRPLQRGAIVNIVSQVGIVERRDAPAYCASKAAVIAMTRADAIDSSEDGIRVSCVCPGVIETPRTMHREECERFRPAVEIAPMKRMGQPEEVADAVLFLCSSFAPFIQGRALVDGGYISTEVHGEFQTSTIPSVSQVVR